MPTDPIRDTRRWIETIVIGLNLCPFARRVFDAETIRYVVTDANDATSLLDALTTELQRLVAEPISTIETTILIHPHVLQDFLDYNDFLRDADQLLETLGLTGIVQIASFHPEYRFAGTKPDAVDNFTNRSPFPMLHLLREESVTKVANDPDFLDGIPERNIAVLRALGRTKLLAMLKN
jgi:uncharacterized protein